jgi:hypothetical protein
LKNISDMNDDNKYSRVIESLKRNRPILQDRERLTDDIMREIKKSSAVATLPEKLVNYFFAWVNNYWLRGTMAVTAVLFAGFFIIQQLVIADRLDKLERQVVRTLYTINDHEPDLGINQRILLNLVLNEQMTEDSITVSTSDMEELLNYVLELQNKYGDLLQDAGKNPYILKRIRQSLEESTNSDEI